MSGQSKPGLSKQEREELCSALLHSRPGRIRGFLKESDLAEILERVKEADEEEREEM